MPLELPSFLRVACSLFHPLIGLKNLVLNNPWVSGNSRDGKPDGS